VGSSRLDSIWVQANSTQHGSRLIELDVGLYWIGSTCAWFDMGLDPLGLTWARADSTWPGPSYDSTWIQTYLARHRLEPTRLGMTWTQCQLNLVWVSTPLGIRPTQLNLDKGLLGSTLTWVDSTWLLPKSTKLEFDQEWLCSTLTIE